MKKQSTYRTKETEIDRKWFIVDAKGKTLGRLASKIAQILSGKNKTIYTRHLDTGDFVIVINAVGIVVTGNKETQKTYFTHSGYPGGDKLLNFKKVLSTHPDRIIRKAVWGMLPQNKLGKAMLKKLKVYANDKHEHIAQKPELINI